MITIEESIPTKNDNYRLAEDVFYIQFNDISFFIEDEEQENFYYVILSKLFPDIQIEKIFPLNGKANVIADCKNNINDKKKIYLVDKDFDDILNKKEDIINLFYLNRYSIENYLIENDALLEYIISEKPKLKRKEILQNLNIEPIIETIKNKLNELIHNFILVQKKCPKLKNISLSYERFFDFTNGNFTLKQQQFENFIDDIKKELKEVDKRLKYQSQLLKIKNEIIFDSNERCIMHYPGKFIIKMIKQNIESLYGINSRNVESYCYRIACNSNFNSLNYLKENVNNYIK